MWRLLLFLVFMALGTSLVFVLTKREPVRRPSATVPLTPPNVLTMEDVRLEYREGDRLRLELWARSANYDERRRTMALDEVRFTLYDAGDGGEAQDIRGTARKALVDQARDRVIFEGQVHLQRTDDTEIRSERIEYEHKRRRLFAPREVWIRSGTSVHEGRALVYSLAEQKMTFQAPRLTQ